jgi:23S rRNA (cytidine1920-2'-O)/16S rRNA (cytidine1409-2'-O)-methyltransferase
LLLERGLVESRNQAQRLIMAGQVRVDGQLAFKPATTVSGQARIEVDHGPPFVSRGGEKLEAALEAFSLEVSGRVCADVGASTGGFTDCLLQHGAAKVYAIDVGKGLLHWKLRKDPRLVVMESTNARYVESLPERVSLVTVDVSFISLKILLPVVKGWFRPSKLNREEHKDREGKIKPGALGELGGSQKGSGEIVILIKPQFEAGRADVSKGGGVIRDPEIHRQVLLDVLGFAQDRGFGLRGLIRSPLLGPKGNLEFLAWLGLGNNGAIALQDSVRQVLEQTY